MLRQYIALKTQLRVRRDEHGATAVEYGLMVALIAVLIIAAVLAVGEELITLFEDTQTALTGTDPNAGA